jgi:hypothetical protein
MTPEMMAKLRRSLEGWINEQFMADMKYFHDKLSEDFPWFDGLNENRKAALIELSAFMGYKNLCSLDGVLFSLETNDFEQAAFGLLDEKASQYVNGRAPRLAAIIRTGTYDIQLP